MIQQRGQLPLVLVIHPRREHDPNVLKAARQFLARQHNPLVNRLGFVIRASDSVPLDNLIMQDISKRPIAVLELHTPAPEWRPE